MEYIATIERGLKVMPEMDINFCSEILYDRDRARKAHFTRGQVPLTLSTIARFRSFEFGKRKT